MPTPKALREAAEAFYEPPVSAANIEMFGGDPEDYEIHVDLLPSIAPIFWAFTDLQTQWRAGPAGGVTGLIYSSIPFILDAHEITDKAQAMKDIRVMEAAAIAVINRKPGDNDNGGQV